jgi:hypothetical protein
MPVLKNARWELFAQAVANGKLLDDAYADAGYKPTQLVTSTKIDERRRASLTFSMKEPIKSWPRRRAKPKSHVIHY